MFLRANYVGLDSTGCNRKRPRPTRIPSGIREIADGKNADEVEEEPLKEILETFKPTANLMKESAESAK